MWKQSPYEEKHKLQPIIRHSSGWCLYWDLNIKRWTRVFWRFPEDDHWWYSLGPFVFAIDAYSKFGSKV